MGRVCKKKRALVVDIKTRGRIIKEKGKKKLVGSKIIKQLARREYFKNIEVRAVYILNLAK